MDESILLRLKPKLEFVLNETEFEVIDSGDIENEGIYSYLSTESIEYKEEKVNWSVTLLSYVFGIFTESGSGNKFIDRAHLKINLHRKTLKIRIYNVVMVNIEIIKNKLTKRITSLSPSSQNTETTPLS